MSQKPWIVVGKKASVLGMETVSSGLFCDFCQLLIVTCFVTLFELPQKSASQLLEREVKGVELDTCKNSQPATIAKLRLTDKVG